MARHQQEITYMQRTLLLQKLSNHQVTLKAMIKLLGDKDKPIRQEQFYVLLLNVSDAIDVLLNP